MGAKIAQVRPAQVRPAQVRPAQVRSLSAPDDAAAIPGQDILPVLPALQRLLPSAGLPRGQVVTAAGAGPHGAGLHGAGLHGAGLHGAGLHGAGLLCLALAAGASAAGAWCAAVGLPALGVRAAIEVGLDHDRLLLIPDPGTVWPQVVAALLDGCDLVLLRPPDRPSAQLRRKLEAAARRHGSVLLITGEWEGAQTRLLVTDREWVGIGAGYGRLRACRAQVVAEGRGAGTRPRAAWLWLPGPDGAVVPATDMSPGLASPRPSAGLASSALAGAG